MSTTRDSRLQHQAVDRSATDEATRMVKWADRRGTAGEAKWNQQFRSTGRGVSSAEAPQFFTANELVEVALAHGVQFLSGEFDGIHIRHERFARIDAVPLDRFFKLAWINDPFTLRIRDEDLTTALALCDHHNPLERDFGKFSREELIVAPERSAGRTGNLLDERFGEATESKFHAHMIGRSRIGVSALRYSARDRRNQPHPWWHK